MLKIARINHPFKNREVEVDKLKLNAKQIVPLALAVGGYIGAVISVCAMMKTFFSWPSIAFTILFSGCVIVGMIIVFKTDKR